MLLRVDGLCTAPLCKGVAEKPRGLTFAAPTPAIVIAMTGVDESQIARLADVCRRNSIQVAVAESLTSGLLANEIGRGDSAQKWFRGGIIAYQMEIKERMLGVPDGTDPTSSECATQLARGVRELFGADIAVSTTGVGGPDPQDGHPAGTVYIGWATADDAGAVLAKLDGEPAEIIRGAAALAVDRLIDQLRQV